MRNTRCIICLAASVVTAAGCSVKEPAPGQVPAVDGIAVTFRSDFSDAAATKTLISDGQGSHKSVSWAQGDVIKIWSVNASGELVGVEATADTAGETTTFSATVPEASVYYGVHPADAAFSLEKDPDTGEEYCIVTLPKQDGSFNTANVCVSRTTLNESHFSFRNIAPVVKVSTARTINAVDVFDLSRQGIEGRLKVGFSAQGDVNVSIAETTGLVQSAKGTVENGTAYIAVLPGTYPSGLGIYMTDENGGFPAYLAEGEITLSRKEILNLGDIDSKTKADMYVSTTGSGDGLSSSSPMSFTRFTELVGYESTSSDTEVAAAEYQAKAFRVAGRVFHFAPGTYYFTKQVSTYFSGATEGLFSTDGVRFSIVGDEGAGQTFFDGSKAAGARMFYLNSFGRPFIEGITFQNGGSANGGAIDITAKREVTIKDCVFRDNKSTSVAGAVYVNGGVVRFENCLFENNEAATQAGAIKCNTATGKTTLVGCTFRNNKAESSYGGAVVLEETSTAKAQLTCTDCLFEGNSSGTNSGAIRVNGGILSMNNCVFSNNEAVGSGSSTYAGTGGAIYIGTDGSLATIENSLFEGNKATTSGAGGAINFQAKTTKTVIRGCTFKGNSTINSGAIALAGKGPDVTIEDCIFTGNTASKYGGVSYLTGGVTKFNRCTFENNTAAVRGGAIYCGDGVGFFNACIFDGNAMSDSVDFPNAIYSSSPSNGFLAVTNSTIYTGSEAKGTYDIFGLSTMLLAYNTIVSDCAKAGHAAIYSTCDFTPEEGSDILYKSVILGNIVKEASGTAVLVAGGKQLADAGFNIVSDTPALEKTTYDGGFFYNWSGESSKGKAADFQPIVMALSIGTGGTITSLEPDVKTQYLTWIEEVQALEKDQRGIDRDSDAMTPGAVQL